MNVEEAVTSPNVDSGLAKKKNHANSDKATPEKKAMKAVLSIVSYVPRIRIPGELSKDLKYNALANFITPHAPPK